MTHHTACQGSSIWVSQFTCPKHSCHSLSNFFFMTTHPWFSIIAIYCQGHKPIDIEVDLPWWPKISLTATFLGLAVPIRIGLAIQWSSHSVCNQRNLSKSSDCFFNFWKCFFQTRYVNFWPSSHTLCHKYRIVLRFPLRCPIAGTIQIFSKLGHALPNFWFDFILVS